jgi:hypothetical protein
MIEQFLDKLREHTIDFQAPWIILDVGSPDYAQSIEFYHAFPQAQIFAFAGDATTLPPSFADRITPVTNDVGTFMEDQHLDGSVMMWMADLTSLESMGERLVQVEFVHTESSHMVSSFLGAHQFASLTQDEVIYKNMSFDVVVPVGPCDLEVVCRQLECTRRNVIGRRNVYVVIPVGSPPVSYEGVTVVTEDLFPFSFADVVGYGIPSDRAGWFLQQLIKLYAGFVIPGLLPRYLVLDADTCFLKPTTFTEGPQLLYWCSLERHEPYMQHMNRLLPTLTRYYHRLSGICHHMMLDRAVVQEFMNAVADHQNDLEPFWRHFLKCVDPLESSGASEYELYFAWICHYHKQHVKLRPLRWANVGLSQLEEQLASPTLDFASCHWYRR